MLICTTASLKQHRKGRIFVKFRYITIEREYGSGARMIGNKLAQKLDIPCYGTQILEMAAQKLNTTVERIRSLEEKSVGSLLYTIEMMGRIANGDTNTAPKSVQIHAQEQSIIQELAKRGPAVFVGRCAGFALRNEKRVLHVFIRSDWETRKRRVIEEYGINPGLAESYMRQIDKRRANYYFINTGKRWKDPEEYHMLLDSSAIGIDNCADILAAAMKEQTA